MQGAPTASMPTSGPCGSILDSSSLTFTCVQSRQLVQDSVQKQVSMRCVRHHLGRLLTRSGLHRMHASLTFICLAGCSHSQAYTVCMPASLSFAWPAAHTLRPTPYACQPHFHLLGRLLTLSGLHHMHASLTFVCAGRTSRKLMVSVPGTTFLTCACHTQQATVKGSALISSHMAQIVCGPGARDDILACACRAQHCQSIHTIALD